MNINLDLKKIALKVATPKQLNNYVCYGQVGAAIQAHSGNIYTGVSIDTACSLGFCAEHAAVAEMLKHGESQVKAFVAVDSQGNALPPCGRCRELISQLNIHNRNALVEVENGVIVSLAQLLPYDWKEHLPNS